MKICVVGNGAFGKKHLEALSNIEDVEVVCWKKRRGN
jgi:2-hydroxy-4-carboxymuconate semialdehyde hemiacetal dehydrogenase